MALGLRMIKLLVLRFVGFVLFNEWVYRVFLKRIRDGIFG